MSMRPPILERFRALHRPPRFHGNGFTQLYLSPSERLHVWDSRLPPHPGHNATIHTHVWDMASTVLLGSVTHTVYDWEYDTEHGEHEVWQFQDKPSGEPSAKVRMGQARVWQTTECRMTRHSHYTFRHDVLHQTTSDNDWAATLMRKIAVPDGPTFPFVVAPIGHTAHDAFSPELRPPTGLLWEVIDMAVALMEPWQHQMILATIEGA